MEQPASSKAARAVFVVRTCSLALCECKHTCTILVDCRSLGPGGGTLLFVLCWQQVSQLYVKADKTDALEDIVEELKIRDLSRQEEGLHLTSFVQATAQRFGLIGATDRLHVLQRAPG